MNGEIGIVIPCQVDGELYPTIIGDVLDINCVKIKVFIKKFLTWSYCIIENVDVG